MPIFVWHLILFSYFTDIVLLFIDQQQINDLHNTLLAPLYTIAAIFLIVFGISVFKKKYLLKPLFSKVKLEKEYA